MAMHALDERVQVFIDCGNFYHLVLKKLGLREIDFNLDAFVAFLADGRVITEYGKRFYVGTVREKEGDLRSKQNMAEQTRLFSTLKNTAWEIKTSKLRTRVEEIVIDNRVKDYKKILRLGIRSVVI